MATMSELDLILQDYAEYAIDGVDIETLAKLAKDAILNDMRKLTPDEIIEIIREHCPYLLNGTRFEDKG